MLNSVVSSIISWWQQGAYIRYIYYVISHLFICAEVSEEGHDNYWSIDCFLYKYIDVHVPLHLP